MLFPLTAYTSAMEVRALLGVSAKELKDEQLDLPIYRQLLSMDLGDLDPQLEDELESILALPSPSGNQAKLLAVSKLFSGYCIALHIFPTLEQLAPQKITDGKAEIQRQTQDLSTLKAGLEAGKQRVQSRVLDVYKLINVNVATSTLVIPTFVLGSTLPTDPVTDA